MSEPRALQKNAADRQQRNYAERTEKQREERRREHYRAVMNTREGRFVLWDLILDLGVFTQFEIVTDEVLALVGARDRGLRLMKRLQVSAPEVYPLMEQEWFAQQRRDNAETDEVHSRAVTAQTEDEITQ